ncbi:MAG: PstS family phosphate ABC transporter substrate-binding protein [Candidatus Micrarchaeia archaeon]
MKAWVFCLLVGVLFFGCVQPEGSSLKLKGSDTELQMFSALAEEFVKANSGVSVTVTGGGSGTGIAALLNGEVDMADSSRPMTDEEVSKARQRGVEPLEFVVARDGLAVVVHKSNGVSSLSLQQLADLYTGKITNWNQLGGEDREITLYGRQSTSGTYVYFRNVVLKADYSSSMRNMEGTASIVDAVSSDKSGVGYVGLGYVTGAVSVVSLEGFSPLDKSVVETGEYPLTRPLYQYVNSNSQNKALLKLFLEFEVSKQGQEVVEGTGFLSINSGDVSANNLAFEGLVLE